MSRLIAALLLIQLSAPAVLAGQAAVPTTLLPPGARIRITQAGENPRVAILVAQNSEEIVVRGPRGANDDAVPLHRITRLEVSTGRHRNVLKGLGLGVGIGGAAGLILGAAAYEPCTGMCIMAPKDRGESAALGGVVLGTLGLVAGGLVGLVRHDTWERVPLDGRRAPTTIGLRAGSRGIGVELSF